MKSIEEISGDYERLRPIDLSDFESGEFILDISALPFLQEILDAKPKVIYVPDTLHKLLGIAKQKPKYSKIIEQLFRRQTRRKIDIELFYKAISERKFEEVEIRLITKQDVDSAIYSVFLEEIVREELVIELSQKQNLLGDIAGKIIGFAKKAKRPILMANKALIRMTRKVITIIEGATNESINMKKDFLRRNLRLSLRRTHGVKWYLGFIITIVTIGGFPYLSPLGIVLMILDC